MRKLLLFGIGKIGQVVHHHFATDSDYEVAAFVTDKAHVPADGQFDGVPVIAFEDIEKHYSPKNHTMFIGVGYHGLNRFRAERCAGAKKKGYKLATYISSGNRHILPNQTGENCFVMSGEPLQPKSSIGDNCFVWTNALVGHHTQVGNHCWITSGVTIGGNCRIGEYCFFGLNATIGHELSIGANSLVGAGTLITKEVPEGSVYIAADTPRFRLTSQQFMKMNPL